MQLQETRKVLSMLQDCQMRERKESESVHKSDRCHSVSALLSKRPCGGLALQKPSTAFCTAQTGNGVFVVRRSLELVVVGQLLAR